MNAAITARWTPRQADFERFALLSGDDNPIHVDPEFAARTGFGRTVAHGMLLYGRVWALIRAARPGARHVRQTLTFPAPAYAGEELEITIAPKPEPSPIVSSPLVPEARLRHDVGEGQGGGDRRTSAVGVPPTPNPSPSCRRHASGMGGGESRRRSGGAATYAIRVARIHDGAEVLIGECSIEERG